MAWQLQLTIRDPETILKLGLNAQFVEPDVDLRAAAMHQHWPDPNC